ncbi:MAG: DUF5916 domain-containing protein [Acidobacteriota bacterium]
MKYAACALLLFAVSVPLVAQEASPAHGGPPPPTLPETVARDTEGRATIRAVRLDVPLRIDGQLNEDLYRTFAPISGFVQVEPKPGAPATEKTEVWIAFDDDHVYVGVRASESRPERMVADEMRRDAPSVFQNENFAFAFDTFLDRRNSVAFQFNPVGGRMDGQNVNEGQYNGDWNPVWDFAVHRVEGGWAGEAAVPFKSLRYQPGREQVWGVQLRRINRWKNEISFLTRVPDGLGTDGLFRTSSYGALVGLEAPPRSRAVDVKPYLIGKLSTDLTGDTPVRDAMAAHGGVDVKYGLTEGLTADFSYNTDFAQAEADEQQINLTRFSTFFPEKRDFFLENQGIFNFGGAGTTAQNIYDTPIMFYSRRIGLDQGEGIPVLAGGRLTGRAGPYTVGLLDMQTQAVDRLGVPATNFAVVRVKRDVLRRSSLGAIATRRSHRTGGEGSGETYGVDGTLAILTNLSVTGYWARTRTPGLQGEDMSYRVNSNYNGDRYGFMAEHMMTGGNFNPEAGFVRRRDFRKGRVAFRFSPRPTRIPRVRKFSYEVQGSYYETLAGVKENRDIRLTFQTEFQTSDRIVVQYLDSSELLASPFRLAPGVVVPPGPYHERTLTAQAIFGQQRAVSGTAFVEHGPFYGGSRTAYGLTGGRVKVNTHLAFEPGVQVNRVDLPFGAFTSTLVSTRGTYAITPKMFLSGLVQYNSTNSTFGANIRLRWEYLPGSELFVVYSEGRDTLSRGFPRLETRSVVVKVNRLLRF